VGVLQQIRRCLVDQTIGKFGGLLHRFILPREFGSGKRFERFSGRWYIGGIFGMTPRCIAKLRPIKQRANLFAGD
jgi:hypothetical protein